MTNRKGETSILRYEKGYVVDENMRVMNCPKCENEIFSTNASHCKLCGTQLYNKCEGTPEYDGFGNVVDHEYHNNPGNARYCETCGEPTYFFKQGFLKPWEEEKAELEQKAEMDMLEHHTLDGEDETPKFENDVFDEDLPF